MQYAEARFGQLDGGGGIGDGGGMVHPVWLRRQTFGRRSEMGDAVERCSAIAGHVCDECEK